MTATGLLVAMIVLNIYIWSIMPWVPIEKISQRWSLHKSKSHLRENMKDEQWVDSIPLSSTPYRDLDDESLEKVIRDVRREYERRQRERYDLAVKRRDESSWEDDRSGSSGENESALRRVYGILERADEKAKTTQWESEIKWIKWPITSWKYQMEWMMISAIQ